MIVVLFVLNLDILLEDPKNNIMEKLNKGCGGGCGGSRPRPVQRPSRPKR